MSFSSYLGSFGNSNWNTYITTPNVDTNVELPSTTPITLNPSPFPILPKGYYSFSLQYEIQAIQKEIINQYNIDIYSTNGLNPVSTIVSNYTYLGAGITNKDTNTQAVRNVISGIFYSDGTVDTQVNIQINVITQDGNACNWMSFNNSSIYPSLNVIKIG